MIGPAADSDGQGRQDDGEKTEGLPEPERKAVAVREAVVSARAR